MCIFANVPPAMQVALIHAATGLDWTPEEMLRAGERGWNLKRAINCRLGLSAAHDRLPKALLEPYAEGGAAGFVPDLPAMLQAYYAVRGWDPATGRPTRERLLALGLSDVAADLWE